MLSIESRETFPLLIIIYWNSQFPNKCAYLVICVKGNLDNLKRKPKLILAKIFKQGKRIMYASLYVKLKVI